MELERKTVLNDSFKSEVRRWGQRFVDVLPYNRYKDV